MRAARRRAAPQASPRAGPARRSSSARRTARAGTQRETLDVAHWARVVGRGASRCAFGRSMLYVSNCDAEGCDGVRAPRDHQKFMNARSSPDAGRVGTLRSSGLPVRPAIRPKAGRHALIRGSPPDIAVAVHAVRGSTTPCTCTHSLQNTAVSIHKQRLNSR